MELNFVVLVEDNVIQTWSTARLPFEPTGWKVEMRGALRDALGRLEPVGGHVLHGYYAAADDGQLSDVENLLLYNVGSTYLRHLVRTGIRVERGFRVPSPPVALATDRGEIHYTRYKLRPTRSPFENWVEGDLLGQLISIETPTITKPGPVWRAIRDHAQPLASPSTRPVRVTLRVTISGPSTMSSVVDAVKPVLDGVVSAHHAHSVTPPVDLVERMVAAGLGTPDDLREQLVDRRWAVLGGREVVRPFGESGVQWNPADDHCVAAEVLLGEPVRSGYRIDGELRRAVRRDEFIDDGVAN